MCYLVYRLAISPYKIYATFNVAVLVVMTSRGIPQSILKSDETTSIESGFISIDSGCYCLFYLRLFFRSAVIEIYISLPVEGVLATEMKKINKLQLVMLGNTYQL